MYGFKLKYFFYRDIDAVVIVRGVWAHTPTQGLILTVDP